MPSLVKFFANSLFEFWLFTLDVINFNIGKLAYTNLPSLYYTIYLERPDMLFAQHVLFVFINE